MHIETLKTYTRKKLYRCSSGVEEEKDGGSDLGGHKTMMGERRFTSYILTDFDFSTISIHYPLKNF